MRSNRKTYGLWVVVSFLLLGCVHSDSSLPFDPQIEGLSLVRLVTGEEALKAIDRLHGTPIHVVGGFIAHYEGLHGKATIWVSEATSEDVAQEQIKVMMDKMRTNERSPFSHYRSWDKKGLRVIAFDGMGQVHYVFRDNRWVYWVSADSESIDMMLKHIQRTG